MKVIYFEQLPGSSKAWFKNKLRLKQLNNLVDLKEVCR